MDYEVIGKIVPVIVAMDDHVRLSEKDYKTLFGNKTLTKVADLGQEGEWIAEEKLFADMGNGAIAPVNVVMPCIPSKTRVSLCSSTLARLGGKADLIAPDGAPRSDRIFLESTIEPFNHIQLRNSVLRPLRHLHVPLAVRDVYGLCLGDTVIAEINGNRGVVLDQVVVVDSPNLLGKEIELHIDKDEAFAFGVFEEQTYAKIYVKQKEQANDDTNTHD